MKSRPITGMIIIRGSGTRACLAFQRSRAWMDDPDQVQSVSSHQRRLVRRSTWSSGTRRQGKAVGTTLMLLNGEPFISLVLTTV